MDSRRWALSDAMELGMGNVGKRNTVTMNPENSVAILVLYEDGHGRRNKKTVGTAWTEGRLD